MVPTATKGFGMRMRVAMELSVVVVFAVAAWVTAHRHRARGGELWSAGHRAGLVDGEHLSAARLAPVLVGPTSGLLPAYCGAPTVTLAAWGAPDG